MPKNIRFARVDVESVVSAGHLSISGITRGMRSIYYAEYRLLKNNRCGGYLLSVVHSRMFKSPIEHRSDHKQVT
jgi:hypothetical protein